MEQHGTNTCRYKMDDGQWYVIRWGHVANHTESMVWNIFRLGGGVIADGEVDFIEYDSQAEGMLDAHSVAYRHLKEHVDRLPATMKQMNKIMYQVDHAASLNTKAAVIAEILEEIRS